MKAIFITILIITTTLSSYTQSILLSPTRQSSSKSSHSLDGSLTVAGDIVSSKNGFTHPDGSLQLTASSNPNLPFSSYTAIYATFENPDFDGEVDTPGHEGAVALVAANLDVEKANLNPSSPGNKRIRPLLIKKGLDAATPYLFEAFDNNVVLGDVTIEFWRNDGLGSQELKFKYTLKNTIVASILHLDHKTSDGSLIPLEMVKLAFQEMDIEDVENAKTITLTNF